MRSGRANLFISILRVLSVSLSVLCSLTLSGVAEAKAQGANVDYSKFLHGSQRHASQACTSCHERADNSATPRFPGHRACTGCHLGQFTTPTIPMCMICHSDTNGAKPPVRAFPTSFKESFNVNFDHAQHLKGSARPQGSCSACHSSPVLRGAGLSIPANLAAHNLCYTCHTATSTSSSGREIASCGVCHNVRRYNPSTTNSRAYRLSFSHAKHSAREHLTCNDCHSVTAGQPQSRQVSSPAAAQHFAGARGTSCASCHNGRRSFGGDLSFKDCRRCHTSTTFRMGT
jgi:c(7)-type cytochrome triheme protein